MLRANTSKGLVIQVFIGYLLFWLMTIGRAIEEDCPAKCDCFKSSGRPNMETEVLEALKRRNFLRSSVNITACQRVWLEDVPSGVPSITTDLYLAHNKIEFLNASQFINNTNLQALVLADNDLQRISPDTFLNMTNLTYLDLSDNSLAFIADGTFCPWAPPGYKIPCPIAPSNETRPFLSLILSGNPWICTCSLQTFIENYTCEYVRHVNSKACVSLESASDTSNIGFCDTPKFTIHIPLNRLSSEVDKTGFGRLMVNTCLDRKNNIDFVLLFVMLSWIGATIVYVIHFISWNNKEIARHKSYISSLEASKAAQENFEKRQQQQTPGLSVNDKVIEEPRFLSTSQTLMTSDEDSPVWKHRNKSQELQS